MLRLRPAGETPPHSTTWLKTSRLVSRSMQPSHYPVMMDNASSFLRIITSQATLHPSVHTQAPLPEDASTPEESAMSEMPRTESFQQATEITKEIPAQIGGEIPQAKAPAPKRNVFRRAALVLALLAGTATVAYYGHDYWTNGRYLESTDDAYVKADSTIISPKVSGYIAQVLVGDNEHVKPGQLLAKIDDRDFKAALGQPRADVAASEAAVRNLDAQIALQQPIIEQGTADIAAAEATLKFAQEEQARYDSLMKTV